MKVIDAFLYSGLGAEAELAELRIRELAPLVDQHLAVMGDRTFQGAYKDHLLTTHDVEVLQPYQEKLLWCVVPLPEHAKHPMDREITQRNGMLMALAQMNIQPDDYILISDVDEIPRKDALHHALHHTTPLIFWQKLFHGYITMHCRTEPWWMGTRILTYKDLLRTSPQHVRMNRSYPALANAGWHFSFLGGPQAMQEKLAAWAHIEQNTSAYNTLENLEGALRDVRDWEITRNMEYEIVPLDDTYPAHILNNLQVWQQHIK